MLHIHGQQTILQGTADKYRILLASHVLLLPCLPRQSTLALIRTSPGVLLFPLLVGAVLIAVGVWAVCYEAQKSVAEGKVCGSGRPRHQQPATRQMHPSRHCCKQPLASAMTGKHSPFVCVSESGASVRCSKGMPGGHSSGHYTPALCAGRLKEHNVDCASASRSLSAPHLQNTRTATHVGCVVPPHSAANAGIHAYLPPATCAASRNWPATWPAT